MYYSSMISFNPYNNSGKEYFYAHFIEKKMEAHLG